MSIHNVSCILTICVRKPVTWSFCVCVVGMSNSCDFSYISVIRQGWMFIMLIVFRQYVFVNFNVSLYFTVNLTSDTNLSGLFYKGSLAEIHCLARLRFTILVKQATATNINSHLIKPVFCENDIYSSCGALQHIRHPGIFFGNFSGGLYFVVYQFTRCLVYISDSLLLKLGSFLHCYYFCIVIFFAQNNGKTANKSTIY